MVTNDVGGGRLQSRWGLLMTIMDENSDDER